VPGQDNWSDCGVYLLHYAEVFCRNPPKKGSDLGKWFPAEEMLNKRAEIRFFDKKFWK
jgi:sentrin-specific protease 7